MDFQETPRRYNAHIDFDAVGLKWFSAQFPAYGYAGSRSSTSEDRRQRENEYHRCQASQLFPTSLQPANALTRPVSATRHPSDLDLVRPLTPAPKEPTARHKQDSTSELSNGTSSQLIGSASSLAVSNINVGNSSVLGVTLTSAGNANNKWWEEHEMRAALGLIKDLDIEGLLDERFALAAIPIGAALSLYARMTPCRCTDKSGRPFGTTTNQSVTSQATDSTSLV